MDEEYERIYDELYVGWSEEAYVPEFAGAPERASTGSDLSNRVSSVVGEADRRLMQKRKHGLRSDAKALLLLNFTNMVAVPLALHGDDLWYLDEGLHHDVDLIVQTANPDKEGRISAHAILDALTENWSNLKLGDISLWGAKPQYE